MSAINDECPTSIHQRQQQQRRRRCRRSTTTTTAAAAAAMGWLAVSTSGVSADTNGANVQRNAPTRKKVDKRRRMEYRYAFEQQHQEEQEQEQEEHQQQHQHQHQHQHEERRRLGIHDKGKGNDSDPYDRYSYNNYDHKPAPVTTTTTTTTAATTTSTTTQQPPPQQDEQVIGSSGGNIHGKNDAGDRYGYGSSNGNTPAAAIPSPSPPTTTTTYDEGSIINMSGTNDDPTKLSTSQLGLSAYGKFGLTGLTVPTSRFPYAASLQIEGNAASANYDYHVCTGTLVAPDVILTAAHCNKYTDATGEVHDAFNGIEVGRVDLGEEGREYDPLDMDTWVPYYENLIPEKRVVHPGYDDSTYEHDVMLVKVYGTSYRESVRVNRFSNAPRMEGEEVVALGWGGDNERGDADYDYDYLPQGGNKYSDLLMEAPLNYMSNSQCRDTQVTVTQDDGTSVTTSLRGHIKPSMMCASTPTASATSSRHVCHGDAGGPIIDRGSNGPSSDVLLGVLSWGYGCVDPSYPAVSVRASSHYEWIRDTICEVSSDPPDYFSCPPRDHLIGALTSGGRMDVRTVTLKLKLDAVSEETGWVIETMNGQQVAAQRQVGHYVGMGNDVVLEPLRLPANEWYKLTLLDGFGDGFCCDFGGGSGIVFEGTDAGHYTGTKLVEVDGRFEFSNDGTFYVGDPSGTIMVGTGKDISGNDVSGNDGSGNGNGESGSINATPRPTPSPTKLRGSGGGGGGGGFPGGGPPTGNSNSGGNNNNNNNNSNGGNNNNNGVDTPVQVGWCGPKSHLDWEFCSGFCERNENALTCGEHTCVCAIGENEENDNEDEEEEEEDSQPTEVVSLGWCGPEASLEHDYCTQFCELNPAAVSCGQHGCDCEMTSVSDEPFTSYPTISPTDSPISEAGQDFFDTHEYYVTIQFLFDDKPQDVSWVLYDITSRKAKVFVDFGVYAADDFANKRLNIVVNVDGPDQGERDYAFTVYDKSEDGLCCEHGEGYYKVFLGDTDDEIVLLGGDEFEFSDSFTFTLFKDGEGTNGLTNNDSLLSTDRPTPKTGRPTPRPTPRPTRNPTSRPTRNPTDRPTPSPTSLAPTTEPPTRPWERKRTELADNIGRRWDMVEEVGRGVFTDVGGDLEQFKFHLEKRAEEMESLSSSLPGGRGGGIAGSALALALSSVLAMLLL